VGRAKAGILADIVELLLESRDSLGGQLQLLDQKRIR
jgi:hypothetical protein